MTTLARAQVPALKTPEGAFEVYEWVVFVCDPNQSQPNAVTMYPSTLPEFVGSRRAPSPAEKAGEPQPVGVIRFKGDNGKDTVDVQLSSKGAKFLALWPKAQTRSNAALWQNLTVGSTAPASQEQAGGGSWLNALRGADAPFLLKDGRGENFLLYDAEPNFKFGLTVSPAGTGQYTVANTDKLALHDVTFYKREDDGWHTGAVASLASPAATTKPSTTRAATTQATTTQAGTTVTLAASNLKDDAAIVAPWKDKLAAAGLPATDNDTILSILQHHALDSRRLTAIYRLDADEMDQLLPLEVTPQPRKTVRIGLVIAKNIDPAILHEVEDLIAQLGDPSWEKRDAAHEALAKLGVAAKPKLEASLKAAKDPEAVYRIEQLLGAIVVPQGPVPPQ